MNATTATIKRVLMTTKKKAHVAFTTFLPQLLTYGAYKFEATIKRIMTRRKKIMKYVFHFTSLYYVTIS